MGTVAPIDRVAVLIPVFNDWESLEALLPEIDAALASAGLRGRVTIVDDGSTLQRPNGLGRGPHASLATVDVVRLRCNLGHQRAIAVGLTHLSKSGVGADAVVVMDGDGEDRPGDIVHLVKEWSARRGRCEVVFAARTKRLESPVFRLLYHLYRFVHWLLTGIAVRVGNFSVISSSALPRFLVTPEVWNHYAAAVFRSRLPFATLPLARGKRYRGASHMRYSALVAHGLSAVAVFSDVVGARLLILFLGTAVAAIVLLVGVIVVRLATDYAIPGWATNAAGLLLLVAMQAMLSLMILALLVLGDRSNAKIIALRDADLFVEAVERVSEET